MAVHQYHLLTSVNQIHQYDLSLFYITHHYRFPNDHFTRASVVRYCQHVPSSSAFYKALNFTPLTTFGIEYGQFTMFLDMLPRFKQNTRNKLQNILHSRVNQIFNFWLSQIIQHTKYMKQLQYRR
jgi:hypothetical protein